MLCRGICHKRWPTARWNGRRAMPWVRLEYLPHQCLRPWLVFVEVLNDRMHLVYKNSVVGTACIIHDTDTREHSELLFVGTDLSISNGFWTAWNLLLAIPVSIAVEQGTALAPTSAVLRRNRDSSYLVRVAAGSADLTYLPARPDRIACGGVVCPTDHTGFVLEEDRAKDGKESVLVVVWSRRW